MISGGARERGREGESEGERDAEERYFASGKQEAVKDFFPNK